MNRSQLTNFVKGAFFRTGILSLARNFMAQNGITILRYHSVADQPDYCPQSIALSSTLFEQQIAYLVRHYRVISLDTLIDALTRGETIHPKTVVITFDDGYFDNYQNAFPTLLKYGITATFFITAGPVVEGQRFWVGWIQRLIQRQTAQVQNRLAVEFKLPQVSNSHRSVQQLIDWISIQINRTDLSGKTQLLARVESLCEPLTNGDDKNFMMNVEQIQQMHAAGMTVGAHSVSHPILSSLPQDELEFELAESKRLLERALGCTVNHIAFPNGPGVMNFNDSVMLAAKNFGYKSAHTSIRGLVNAQSPQFALRRQGINHELGLGAFAFKLEEQKFGPLLMGLNR